MENGNHYSDTEKQAQAQDFSNRDLTTQNKTLEINMAWIPDQAAHQTENGHSGEVQGPVPEELYQAVLQGGHLHLGHGWDLDTFMFKMGNNLAYR